MNNLSDEEMIIRIREGNLELSELLMNRYKEIVIKKARTLYLIGGDTDDLIQEGMIGLFKAIRDYQPDKDTSFFTFARLCIDRQLYTAIQNSTRQKHLPLNSYISLSHEDEEAFEELYMENPESMMIDQEKAEFLNREIPKLLSPLENKVLRLYIQGYSYIQIAEKLNRTPKSTDNALHRIRSKIREWLEQEKDV